MPKYKSELSSLAARNLKFTVKDNATEVEVTVERLKLFEHTDAMACGPRSLAIKRPRRWLGP
ncbi:MAG: hypothetical protein PHW74_05785 [Desulfobacca sp.]|nr:hypothetical protein [Desulfobacca sp.]